MYFKQIKEGISTIKFWNFIYIWLYTASANKYMILSFMGCLGKSYYHFRNSLLLEIKIILNCIKSFKYFTHFVYTLQSYSSNFDDFEKKKKNNFDYWFVDQYSESKI